MDTTEESQLGAPEGPLSISIPAPAAHLSGDLLMHLSLYSPASLLRLRTMAGPGASHSAWPRVNPQILICILLVLRKFPKVKNMSSTCIVGGHGSATLLVCPIIF